MIRIMISAIAKVPTTKCQIVN